MAQTRPPRRARAQRRAESRRTPATAPPPRLTPWQVIARVRPIAWAGITLTFFVLTAMFLENRTTWYLAVDQFGYLRFANDLLHGTIYHDWPPARALARDVPPQTDMLVQTYIWDHGRLYSRYAPGFPIILAAWTGLFGDDAAHVLNPALFLAMLATLIVIQWRLCRSLWRGTIATTLVVLCPTLVYLWALTPTRDLSAHLCAFIGLAVLVGRGSLGWRSLFGAGVALGFAGSVRPDAVLYLVPASVLTLGRWWPDRSWVTLRRSVAAGALGVSLGLAPSLAFYWVTTGNPFVPTQGVELKRLFFPSDADAKQPRVPGVRVGYPPGWRGGTIEPVQGGGLRFANFRHTFPGNVMKIQAAYGPLLLSLAGLGAAIGLYLRPAFTAAFLAYLLVAIPFFSCWTRPDHRYLVGVWLIMPMLITEGVFGTLELTQRLARHGATTWGRGLAAAAAVLVAVVLATSDLSTAAQPLPAVTRALAAVAGAIFVAAACVPGRRVAMFAGPLLAAVLAWISGDRSLDSLETRASFQRPQARRAAATFRQAVEPDAVVITTEDIGRPMENIEYYGGIHSFYFTDLERWRIPLEQAATTLIASHFRPYLLIPQSQQARARLAPPLVAELVADIPPSRNYDYFVAAAFHRGLPMQLYRISAPELEAGLRRYEAETGKSLDLTGRSP